MEKAKRLPTAKENKVTTEEKLDKLTSVVETLAASVVHRDNQIDAHDRQIDGLIRVAEQHAEQMERLGKRMDQLSRDWQAYLTTIRPPQ
jgi:uncharacterized protein Yka (UPF0111/DUF47 family)